MFWYVSIVYSRLQTKCHDCISYFIASNPVVFLLFVHSRDTSAETTHVGALVRYVGPLGTMELLKTHWLRLATVVRVGLAVLCGGETTEIQHVIIDKHYSDVIMNTMAPQLTSFTIVYSTVWSGADQSSVSLAFVRGIYLWPIIRYRVGYWDVLGIRYFKVHPIYIAVAYVLWRKSPWNITQIRFTGWMHPIYMFVAWVLWRKMPVDSPHEGSVRLKKVCKSWRHPDDITAYSGCRCPPSRFQGMCSYTWRCPGYHR